MDGGVDLLAQMLGDCFSRINKKMSLEWWVRGLIGLRACVFDKMLFK